MRQRKQTSEEDLDSVLKHHNEVQTKLAEEMVLLARNMKENAKAANRIIKDDNKVSVSVGLMVFWCDEHLYHLMQCHISIGFSALFCI